MIDQYGVWLGQNIYLILKIDTSGDLQLVFWSVILSPIEVSLATYRSFFCLVFLASLMKFYLSLLFERFLKEKNWLSSNLRHFSQWSHFGVFDIWYLSDSFWIWFGYITCDFTLSPAFVEWWCHFHHTEWRLFSLVSIFFVRVQLYSGKWWTYPQRNLGYRSFSKHYRLSTVETFLNCS